jgi:hypothetical protein
MNLICLFTQVEEMTLTGRTLSSQDTTFNRHLSLGSSFAQVLSGIGSLDLASMSIAVCHRNGVSVAVWHRQGVCTVW